MTTYAYRSALRKLYIDMANAYMRFASASKTAAEIDRNLALSAAFLRRSYALKVMA